MPKLSPCISCPGFIEYLRQLPWCRQGDNTLLAVQKCTPELIEAIKDHEVKVYPGAIPIKLNLSWLLYLTEKHDEGRPLPMVVVWRPEAIGLWYRRHKSWEFPYDAWQNPTAQAYDQERVRLPADHGGPKYDQYRQEILSRVNQCPSAIPADYANPLP